MTGPPCAPCLDAMALVTAVAGDDWQAVQFIVEDSDLPETVEALAGIAVGLAQWKARVESSSLADVLADVALALQTEDHTDHAGARHEADQ